MPHESMEQGLSEILNSAQEARRGSGAPDASQNEGTIFSQLNNQNTLPYPSGGNH